MQVSEAAKVCLEYHRGNSKENTIKTYEMILTKFCGQFGDRDLYDITTDDAMFFLNQITEGKKKMTRKIRYSHLKAFFNFVKNNLDQNFRNPCETPMMKKMFKAKSSTKWDIIEKETMDEIIFRTTNVRDRLILELMARGGMRVGEVLKLTVDDIQDRKLVIRDPKSGKEREYIFIPQKVADRLKEYIRENDIEGNQRIFSIGYEAARAMVRKAGKLVGIRLRPHDLRRHAASFASRSGVPIEIISKIILRHTNLSTTQMYLGRISDNEALWWIENLYG